MDCTAGKKLWDRFSNSDEIYVITSVISIDPFDTKGETKVRTEKHPLTKSYYSDVDTGEKRNGPIATIFNGPASNISLVASVVEQDDGSPDAYKDEVDVIVKAAVAVAVSLGVDPTLASELSPLISWAVNSLLGSDDDLISDEYTTLSWSELIAHVNHTPKTSESLGGIPYHFYSEHEGDGASYFVFYGARYIRS